VISIAIDAGINLPFGVEPLGRRCLNSPKWALRASIIASLKSSKEIESQPHFFLQAAIKQKALTIIDYVFLSQRDITDDSTLRLGAARMDWDRD